MTFKTLLRKWHTWLGIILSGPMLVLLVTGVYILLSPKSTNQLISTATCSNGQILRATSSGLYLNEVSLPIIFSMDSIGAMSCTHSTIDIAINYGPIMSTNRQKIRWKQFSNPFSQPIKRIDRIGDTINITLINAIWSYREGEWHIIQSFQPSIAQTIYKLHAGWVGPYSFKWMWLITSLLWVILIGSGIWIFIRMKALN
tara:strand:- start:1949 stop:2548 length:600 start_codon:yes stop_codon:yes gene_type:complete